MFNAKGICFALSALAALAAAPASAHDGRRLSWAAPVYQPRAYVYQPPVVYRAPPVYYRPWPAFEAEQYWRWRPHHPWREW
jgi:hypothetical protein